MANRKKKKTVAVVTGTRADFGLLRGVIDAMRDERALDVKVVVTGVHLTTGTWREVKKSVGIDAKVVMQRKGEVGRPADVQALGRGLMGLGKVFGELGADVVMVLGDRIEALAGGVAGSVGGIHVAHIHGGDRAEGVADESMRHAVSKLAHLHFAATATSRRRLIRMGEVNDWVFRVGSPAIDGLKDVVGDVGGVEVVVMQHPCGGSDAQERKWLLCTLAGTVGWKRMVMGPNCDAGSVGIRGAICAKKVEIVEHLARARFLEVLAGAKVIVGNSSAGLIEAAGLGVACVNIGPRQGGREQAGNVINCEYGKDGVFRAVKKAMLLDFGGMRQPYGDGKAGIRVAKLLGEIDLDGVPLRKRNSY